MEKQLLENPFWNKKLDRALKIRDVDKDGVISRSDFELTLKRFSQVEGISQERLATYRRHVEEMCTKWGLTDASKSLSYDEMKRITAKIAEDQNKRELFTDLFNLLDTNQDGDISFTEWQTFYRCMGVDLAYAKASFDAVDRNGDGGISRDEFLDYHCEFLFSTENNLNSAILYGPLD